MASMYVSMRCIRFLLLCISSVTVTIAEHASDVFDDEFGYIKSTVVTPEPIKPPPVKRQVVSKQASQETYYLEAFFLLLFLVYAITFWYGRKRNDAIVVDWAGQFCKPGMLLHNNFALVGPGYTDDEEELVMKNSNSEYQLWASGRRFCSGMLLTLKLRARQDLLTLASYLLHPYEDHLLLQVSMNARTMPPTVLAVARQKELSVLQRTNQDLRALAKPTDPAGSGLRSWPEALHAVAESAVVLADLLGPLSEALFGSRAFAAHGHLFLWLHISSEYMPEEAKERKPVLRMCFSLPPCGRMHELQPLLEAAMRLIDILGAYEMPAKPLEKAERARAEIQKAHEKENRKNLEETVQQRKQARKEAEMDKVKKMTPAARQKYEERQKRIETARMLKKKTVRI